MIPGKYVIFIFICFIFLMMALAGYVKKRFPHLMSPGKPRKEGKPTPDLFRCVKSEHCTDIDCFHKKPHSLGSSCLERCITRKAQVSCIRLGASQRR